MYYPSFVFVIILEKTTKTSEESTVTKIMA